MIIIDHDNNDHDNNDINNDNSNNKTLSGIPTGSSSSHIFDSI